jgi:hypothetical protein
VSQPVEDLVQDADDAGGRPRVGRHPVDPVSLVAGLLSVGVALLALLSIDVDAGVVLPALLLLAGAAGLLSAARRTRGAPGN